MVGITEKRCRTCGIVKPVGCFLYGGYTKDGYHTNCLECEQSTPVKKCQCCKRILPRSAFCRHSGTYDGLQKYCKACANNDRNARLARKAEEARKSKEGNH